MKQFLFDLLKYNVWADKAILETVELNQDRVNSRILILISHLLNAQIFWYSRVLKKEIKIKVWDVYEIGQLNEIMNENVDHITFILKNFELDDAVVFFAWGGGERVESASAGVAEADVDVGEAISEAGDDEIDFGGVGDVHRFVVAGGGRDLPFVQAPAGGFGIEDVGED